ncbi:FAD-dependent urate hydroxylase [compost metagenome]
MDSTIASETWGTGGRFGIVPLSKGRIYWFACVRAREADPDIAAYGSSELLGRFDKYHSPIPEIIGMTANEQLLHHDLYDIRPLRRFVYQRTALLGDAAHAMTPNMGQGACQAIEDAVLLGRSLELSDTLEEGLDLYEHSRVSRTSKIVRLSRTIGAVAQWENRAAAGLRNAILRSMPKDSAMKQLNFLYRINLEPHGQKGGRT